MSAEPVIVSIRYPEVEGIKKDSDIMKFVFESPKPYHELREYAARSLNIPPELLVLVPPRGRKVASLDAKCKPGDYVAFERQF